MMDRKYFDFEGIRRRMGHQKVEPHVGKLLLIRKLPIFCGTRILVLRVQHHVFEGSDQHYLSLAALEW